MIVRILPAISAASALVKELHPLVRVEVVLHPEFLAGGIDPHEGMRAVTVHAPPSARQTALAHQVGHLMRGLGIAGPE
jgi:hypothetical protein